MLVAKPGSLYRLHDSNGDSEPLTTAGLNGAAAGGAQVFTIIPASNQRVVLYGIGWSYDDTPNITTNVTFNDGITGPYTFYTPSKGPGYMPVGHPQHGMAFAKGATLTLTFSNPGGTINSTQFSYADVVNAE